MSNQARGSGKQEVQGVPPGSAQLLWDKRMAIFPRPNLIPADPGEQRQRVCPR
ncbi:uncharacterized protein TrAFT101_008799 [Trichoderma asperellum]|uniref:uncharacterized protein n=1 Tax=Trichoderma asperellum TaxID=101201 RepID=UPI003327C5BA|nr:hypothetical protein TrAFT101_008799 [Trichoderma asperellum]